MLSCEDKIQKAIIGMNSAREKYKHFNNIGYTDCSGKNFLFFFLCNESYVLNMEKTYIDSF